MRDYGKYYYQVLPGDGMLWNSGGFLMEKYHCIVEPAQSVRLSKKKVTKKSKKKNRIKERSENSISKVNTGDSS